MAKIPDVSLPSDAAGAADSPSAADGTGSGMTVSPGGEGGGGARGASAEGVVAAPGFGRTSPQRLQSFCPSSFRA